MSEQDLLAEITTYLRRAEPVPQMVVAAAKTAYGWRSVVAAVADLEFDSAVDDGELARMRMAAADRRMRFRCPGGGLEVSIVDAGRTLVGRLDPPPRASVLLRHPGCPDTAAGVDGQGQFLFEGLRRGPMSIRVVPEDPRAAGFQTEWVTI